jgi:phosphatidylglycerol:prolipoprotein diacylglycerol transferase
MDMSIRFPNLGLELDYVPKSIRIFGFEFTIYGLLIALGMLLGTAFVLREARRRQKNLNDYLGMLLAALAAGFLGARLFYVAFSWSMYKANLMQIFTVRSGGMAFYGALFGGILGASLYCRNRKLPFMEMADTLSRGVLLAQIIGRWGDFFNRESFGEYTNQIFAMQLPLSSVRAGEVTGTMREELLSIGGVSYVQVSPVFLYESFACLVLFLLLLVVERRKRFQGETFMWYLTWYGFIRAFVEWQRTDKLVWPGTRVGVSMGISVALFSFFGIGILVKRMMTRKRADVRKQREERIIEEEEQTKDQEIMSEDESANAPEEETVSKISEQ